MSTIKELVKGRPVLTYCALAFAISWGGALIVLGPGAFLGTKKISFLELGPRRSFSQDFSDFT